jgi:hypothetical protein
MDDVLQDMYTDHGSSLWGEWAGPSPPVRTQKVVGSFRALMRRVSTEPLSGGVFRLTSKRLFRFIWRFVLSEYQELMEEPPGGYNHGYAASADPQEEGRWLSLDVESAQAQEFMRHGGFGIVEVSRGNGGTGGTYGSGDAGMTNSLSSDNVKPYVDMERVKELVEEELGFTLAQVESAYLVPGRPTAERSELRARIDARLLELSAKGGNLSALARVFGWPIYENGQCRIVERALSRARDGR